jgi:DNA polymerase III subunit gamma/tau
MWDIKYRPLKFSDVLGQKGTIELLKARLSNNSALDTNYIFSGGHGQGKCVVGDTLVSTNKGFQHIKDLMGPNEVDPIDIEIYQEKGVTSRAAFTYVGGLKETIKITTSYGFCIEGTPNHRIRVLQDGKVSWAFLDNLRKGDRICLTLGGIFGNCLDISGFESKRYLRTFKHHVASTVAAGFKLGSTLTHDWARLLGFFMGGHSYYRKNSSTEIKFSETFEHKSKEIQSLMRDLFGSVEFSQGKKTNSPIFFYNSNRVIRQYMSFLGVSSSHDAGIPWCVRYAPMEYILSFLTAYFDLNVQIVDQAIRIGFSSPMLIKEVQVVLLSFGILTRVIFLKGYNFYLEVLPEFNSTFLDLFGSCLETLDTTSLVIPDTAHIEGASYISDRVHVKESSEALVYDLNVPSGEMFSANGFMNHNTTLARILSRAMLCLNRQEGQEPCNECDNCMNVLRGDPGAYVEFDAASGGTIDNIRGIIEDLSFSVLNASKRVYVLDESHRLSRDSQDALLKPLEEKRLVGIFCTTEPEKIRGPIRSRCEEYVIRKVTREDVFERMRMVLDSEKIPFEQDAVMTVIDYSNGHVRDILNRLEMVSQMGPVDVLNVKSYLKLSSISVYYEILLSLGNPSKALELLEELLETVSPEDVASGLSEASMNSYRLAHGMFANFAFVDKPLAKQVFDMYGLSVLKISEFFLKRRFVNKTTLFCDVISFSVSNGVPQQVDVVTSPPVVVSPPVRIETPEVRIENPPPIEIIDPAKEPLVQPVVVPVEPKYIEPKHVEPKQIHKAVGPNVRPDGIGPLGSDPFALGDLDHKAVPVAFPRRQDKVKNIIHFTSDKSNEMSDILTPDQWRREFENAWTALRGR